MIQGVFHWRGRISASICSLVKVYAFFLSGLNSILLSDHVYTVTCFQNYGYLNTTVTAVIERVCNLRCLFVHLLSKTA